MINISRNQLPGRNLIFLSLLFTILSCSNLTPTIGTDVLVKLNRTSCHGDCPVYTIEVKKNGDITYEGTEYVKTLGIRSASISKNAVLSIEAELSKAEFTSMQSELHPGGWGCFISATDHRYIVIEATLGNKTKAVSTYTGCDAEQVKAAIKLADYIDQATEASKWIEGHASQTL